MPTALPYLLESCRNLPDDVTKLSCVILVKFWRKDKGPGKQGKAKVITGKTNNSDKVT